MDVERKEGILNMSLPNVLVQTNMSEPIEFPFKARMLNQPRVRNRKNYSYLEWRLLVWQVNLVLRMGIR